MSLRYGGTAVNGVDYAPLSRRVEIPAGASSVDLLVQALSDEASGKRLVVAVQPGDGYAIGTGEIIRARGRDWTVWRNGWKVVHFQAKTGATSRRVFRPYEPSSANGGPL